MNKHTLIVSDELVSRFLLRAVRTGECLIWTGASPPGYDGYGTFTLRLKDRNPESLRQWRAHRVSFFLFNGAIPDGMFVCHKCDVRLCVEPKHLFLGTNQENTADRDEKGRQVSIPRDARAQSKLCSADCIRALGMFQSGSTTYEIASEFKCSQATAWKAIDQARAGKFNGQ